MATPNTVPFRYTTFQPHISSDGAIRVATDILRLDGLPVVSQSIGNAQSHWIQVATSIGDHNAAPSVVGFKTRSDHPAGFDAVQNNDPLLAILAAGTTGNNSVAVQGISIRTADDWSEGDTPTYLSLFTVPSGSNNALERIRINSDGTTDFLGGINSGNVLMVGMISANGSSGTPGQFLTSNGITTYWSSVIIPEIVSANTTANGVVDTVAQSFAGAKTFTANVLIGTTGILLQPSGHISFEAPTGSAGTPSWRFGGGHITTTMALTANADPNPSASLNLWASEPGFAYEAAGIGMNINAHPHYGATNAAAGRSWIRFQQGHIILHTANTSELGNNHERFRITQAGFVGIANNQPEHALRVDGALSIAGNTTLTGNLFAGGPVNTPNNIDFHASYSAYIANGLFTTNARPIQITTPGSQRIMLGYGDNGGGQYAPKIGFTAGTNAVAHIGLSSNNTGILTIGISTALVNNGECSTERIFIWPNGNVGIGNTVPGHMLRVEGTASFGNTVNVAGLFTTATGVILGGTTNVTASLRVSNQLSVTQNAAFDTNVLFVDAVNNRVGVGNTTPAEMFRVQGLMSYAQTAAFSWNTRSSNTVYTANTDGLVVGILNVVTGNQIVFSGFSDGTATPTTIRGWCYGDATTGPRQVSMMFPVRKGDNWRCVSGNVGTSVFTTYWVPFGTGG